MPAGRKPKPPGTTVHRNPVAHPWQPAPDGGWLATHDKVPTAPRGLQSETRRAWRAWFESWWSAFWTDADLPQLELAIRAYDKVVRNEADLGKVVPLLDKLGLTPKGRQDLRWAPPSGVEDPVEGETTDELAKRRQTRRAKLA